MVEVDDADILVLRARFKPNVVDNLSHLRDVADGLQTLLSVAALYNALERSDEVPPSVEEAPRRAVAEGDQSDYAGLELQPSKPAGKPAPKGEPHWRTLARRKQARIRVEFGRADSWASSLVVRRVELNSPFLVELYVVGGMATSAASVAIGLYVKAQQARGTKKLVDERSAQADANIAKARATELGWNAVADHIRSAAGGTDMERVVRNMLNQSEQTLADLDRLELVSTDPDDKQPAS